MIKIVCQCPECYKEIAFPENRFAKLNVGDEVLCGNCGLTSIVDTKQEEGEKRLLKLRSKRAKMIVVKDAGTDQPVDTQTDFLEMNTLASRFARFLNQRSTPMTIALQGESGIGKTSFLKMIKTNLGHLQEPEAKGSYFRHVSLYSSSADLMGSTHFFYVIEFAAGLFKQSSHIGLLFLLFVIEQLRTIVEGKKYSPQSFRKRLSERASEISNYSDETHEGIMETILNVLDQTEFAFFLEDELRGLSRKVIRKFPNKTVRILVMVDELDILPYDKTQEIIDTIKNNMEMEGFLFILSCESSVLAREWKDERERSAYLSKIFQIVYQIPSPPKDRMMEIARNFSVIKTLIPQYERSFFDILKIFPFLRSNVRNLKRLLNTYELNLVVANLDQNTNHEEKRKMQLILLLLTGLYQYDERCYQHLKEAVRLYSSRQKPNDMLRILEYFARKEELVLQLQANERSPSSFVDALTKRNFDEGFNPRFAVVSGVIQIIVTQGWSEQDLVRGLEYTCQ